jgi:hypothetical protein
VQKLCTAFAAPPAPDWRGPRRIHGGFIGLALNLHAVSVRGEGNRNDGLDGSARAIFAHDQGLLLSQVVVGQRCHF